MFALLDAEFYTWNSQEMLTNSPVFGIISAVAVSAK